MTKTQKAVLFTRNFMIITLINFIVFFSFQMIFPVLPLFIHKLGGSDSTIGLIIGAFTFSTMLTRPIVGYLLDTIGKKSMLLIGLTIFTMVVASYALADSTRDIFILRILHGIGWGFAGTATATIASEMIPKTRFGEGMGYFTLANTLAMAAAPAAGIYFGQKWGYLFVFKSGAILALIGILTAFFLRCKPVRKEPLRLSKHMPYERKAVNPAILLFFVTVTYGAVISFLPLYAFSMDIRRIGLFFVVYAVSILLTRPQIGKIIDRHGFDIIILPGFFCLITGVFILAFAHSLTAFLVTAVFYGIGFGALQTSLQTMAVRDTTFERLGAANATLFSGSDLGIGVGVMSLGSVANRFGYADMYLLTVIPLIVALLYYLFFVRRRAAA